MQKRTMANNRNQTFYNSCMRLWGFVCYPLTLARTGNPTGGAQIFLFIVKTEDVFIASIEKKMGFTLLLQNWYMTIHGADLIR